MEFSRGQLLGFLPPDTWDLRYDGSSHGRGVLYVKHEWPLMMMPKAS